MRLEPAAWALRFAAASAALICIAGGVVAHEMKFQNVAEWFGNIAFFCLLAAVVASYAGR